MLSKIRRIWGSSAFTLMERVPSEALGGVV